MSIVDEFEWRGMLYDASDGTREMFEREQVTAYVGFDPTASSLHVGSLLPIMALARLQRAGHSPIALVGGGTGLIGDPSGKSQERTLLSMEDVDENVRGMRAQLERFLDFDAVANPARMLNNADWLRPVTLLEFLRDTGKHFTVNYMLAKESVKRRLGGDEGISFTEFSYQILQGLDYLELHRQYGCVLQTGGSDQWGNLTSGVDLIRYVEHTAVHAIGTPLITNSDGTKFGKSEGNAIWLDAGMCSPYRMYQFWLNTDDADVIPRLKIFTFLTRAEIEEYARLVEAEPFRRAAQKRLAVEVCTTVHGTDATAKAIAATEALFGRGDLTGLDAATLRSALDELPHAQVAAGTTVVQALVDTGLVSSLSEGRRAIAQGGVSLDGARVESDEEVVSGSLPGDVSVLRRGKKTLAGLFVTPS